VATKLFSSFKMEKMLSDHKAFFLHSTWGRIFKTNFKTKDSFLKIKRKNSGKKILFNSLQNKRV